MQGWHYGKGLIYLRPIFHLTKLAFLKARASYREGKCSNGSKNLNLKIHKWLMINKNSILRVKA